MVPRRFGRTRLWRPHPSCIVYIVVILVTFIVVKFSVDLPDLFAINDEIDSESDNVQDACALPEPLLSGDTPRPVRPKCMNSSQVMFKMAYGSRLERLHKQSSFWKRANCCYHSFWRLKQQEDFNLA